MAGRKQHYIPQALLRGFLINEKGNDRQARVYKKGQAPYPSAIGDIAAARYFYSDLPSTPSKTLDDRITDYEDRLGRLLRTLRSADNEQSVDSALAAEVVAHLSIRGAYLREIFSFGIHTLVDRTATSLENEESARSMLGVDKQEEGSRFTEAVDEQLNTLKNVLPDGLPVPLLRRILLHLVREDFGNLYGQTLPSIRQALGKVVSQIPSAIREGHGNALSAELVPDKRVINLATLSWRVYHAAENLLLPDCVAISVDEIEGAQPYLLGDIAHLGSIMLPLTSNRLLIGRPAGIADNKLSSKAFNAHAASCSTVFFVSADYSEELLALSETIGSIPMHTISELVSETLNRDRDAPDKSGLHDSLIGSDSHEEGQGEIGVASTRHFKASYPVSFKNCATREEAESIAAAVGVVVNEMAASIELNRLNEIIFAGDYVAAFNDIDRGYSPTSPIETTQVEGLVGFGRTVTVIRDGERKVSVILRSAIGHALISDNELEVQAAAHLLTMMLSEVAFQELLESSVVADETYSPWEALFYAPMASAVMAYYSAWMSADIDPSAGSSYRSVFLSFLDHANARIGEERYAYGTHGDVDLFLHAATSALGDLLISMAKLIGHSDARNEPIDGDDEFFRKALSDANLCGWANFYGRDLRRAFSAKGGWRSLADLTSLSCHMERQLWRFFVFPWTTEDGQIRVEIPYMGEHKFGA